MNPLSSSVSVFKKVWHSEWRWLLRTAVLPLLLLIFTLVTSFALYYGNTVTVARINALDSLQHDYKVQYNKLLGQLDADTSTAQGKTDYISATHPAVIDYRLHRSTYHPPVPFSTLATGVSDVARGYYAVTIRRDFVPLEEKVNNPLKLLSGNFDYAFLLVYLLPLMAIAISYNLLSQEKELGTLSLLVIQRGTVTGILLIRLLIRYLVLLLLVLTGTVAGLAIAPATGGFNIADLAAWMGVVAAYLAVWMTLIWFILSWNASSTVNLVSMLCAWLLAVVMVPAVCQYMIARSYGPDLTAANASMQREIGHEAWIMPKKAVLDSFYTVYPQYRDAHAYDTLEGSMRRGMAYFELLERRMKRMLAPQEAAHLHDVQLVAASYRYNPAVYTQALLNGIARNDVTDYDHFRGQTDRFHTTWKEHFYKYHFHDSLFAAADYAALPVYTPAYDPSTANHRADGIIYLAVLSLSLLLAGILVLWKKHVRHTV